MKYCLQLSRRPSLVIYSNIDNTSQFVLSDLRHLAKDAGPFHFAYRVLDRLVKLGSGYEIVECGESDEIDWRDAEYWIYRNSEGEFVGVKLGNKESAENTAKTICHALHEGYIPGCKLTLKDMEAARVYIAAIIRSGQ